MTVFENVTSWNARTTRRSTRRRRSTSPSRRASRCSSGRQRRITRTLGWLQSVVLGLVGKLGVDVLEEDGGYRITAAFDAKIRQRNLYRFT